MRFKSADDQARPRGDIRVNDEGEPCAVIAPPRRSTRSVSSNVPRPADYAFLDHEIPELLREDPRDVSGPLPELISGNGKRLLTDPLEELQLDIRRNLIASHRKHR